MGFTFFLLYLVLTYLRPWEFFPVLAAYRLAFWVGNIGLGISMLGFAARGRFLLLRTPEVYLLIVFVLVLTFSPVLAEGWFGGAAEAFVEFMTALVGCVLALLNVTTVRKFKITAGVLVVLSMVLVGQGWYSYHTGWEYERLVYIQLSDSRNAFGERDAFGRIRALGYLNDPNDFAQALVAVIPWLFLAWQPGRKFRNFLLVMVPAGVLLTGIVLTRSRGGLLSLMCIGVMRVRESMTRFKNSGPLLVGAIAGVGMMGMGLAGGRGMSDESTDGRLEAWRAGIEMLTSHPLTGVGFENFVDHHMRAAHNSFVHCFAELGIIGYFFWLGLLVFAITHLGRIAALAGDEDEETHELARTASALRYSFFGFLTGAFFLSRTYAPTLYLLVGLAIAVHEMSMNEGYPEGETTTGSMLGRTAAAALASIVVVFVVSRVM